MQCRIAILVLMGICRGHSQLRWKAAVQLSNEGTRCLKNDPWYWWPEWRGARSKSLPRCSIATSSRSFRSRQPKTRVELVIIGVDPTEMSFEDVIRTIRSESSASNRASLLVLATPGKEDEARGLIGRGVNRVMLTTDPLMPWTVSGMLTS